MRSLALPTLLLALAAGLALSAPAAAAEGSILAAHHAGIVTASNVRFHSEYVLRGSLTEAIDLAFPLPEGTRIDPSTEIAPVERDGRITGFRVLPPGALRGRVDVLLAEPLDRSGNAVRIAAPLASGDAVQIVEVTGADDLRFEPGASLQLERHVGFFAPPELSPTARAACDRAVQYLRLRTIDDPLYVQTTAQITADEGLRGTLSTREDRVRSGAIGAAAIFLGLVVGLMLLQRRLAGSARIEHAEQTLAAEFEKLDHLDE
ncbi:MAG: hypothetical protein ABJE95_13635 [Byssovorax sp.]